jgi:hypothetical protein
VLLGVAGGVLVGVAVGVLVAVLVGVSVDVLVAVSVGVAGGVLVDVLVGDGIGAKDGVYNSALLPARPPATRTCPLCSRTMAGRYRAVDIAPVANQAPATGSYTSALDRLLKG